MKKKFLLIIWLSVFYIYSVNSQIKINIFNDFAFNQINSFYNNTAFNFLYEINDFSLRCGTNFTFFDYNDAFIDAYLIDFKYSIVKYEFGLNYLNRNISKDIKEDNYNFYAKTFFNRYELALGLNNRIFRLKTEEKSKIWEPFNVMYLFKVNYKKNPLKWNFALGFSNFDEFFIQQEMNPMLFCDGFFDISTNLKIFGKILYKKSGQSHASANNFGGFLRIGILWNIEK